MSQIRDVYLTAAGAYLPGDPLDNDEIARRLGCPDGAGRGARDRVLAANGIRTRHYALDERGEPTMLNEELAAAAVALALKDRGRTVDEVTMLATGTTQGDLIVPGFASMVHGRVGGGPMELLSPAVSVPRAWRRYGRLRPRYGWGSTMWPWRSDLSSCPARCGRAGTRLRGRGSDSTPSSCAGRSPTVRARSYSNRLRARRREPAAGLDAPHLTRARAPGMHVSRPGRRGQVDHAR